MKCVTNGYHVVKVSDEEAKRLVADCNYKYISKGAFDRAVKFSQKYNIKPKQLYHPPIQESEANIDNTRPNQQTGTD